MKDFRIYGQVDDETVAQMRLAMELPISAYGAIMADGHVGYGLPIGGVLATRNAVIPGGVGNDISCGMRACKTNVKVSDLLDNFGNDVMQALLAIKAVVKVGLGQVYEKPQGHELFDRREWNEYSILKQNHQAARNQFSSTGSGNHFIDLCADPEGVLWILIHCGSRNVGAKVAEYFMELAKLETPDVCDKIAYLSMDSQVGQDYWKVMEFCGEFAYAGRDRISEKVLTALGVREVYSIQNHHNFAWKEEHFGEPLIVHRKGATPAGEGVLGIVPGSMGDFAYIVRGKGDLNSLKSCSHGAGRQIGRSMAKGKKGRYGQW